jgi:hypothetical protein
MDCLESLEGDGDAGRRASGVEVALPSNPTAPAPLCPHGGSASALSLAGGANGEAWARCSAGFSDLCLEEKAFSHPLFLTLCDA